MEELSPIIPKDVQDVIYLHGKVCEEYEAYVYRVNKWGTKEEKSFYSTYEEIYNGLLANTKSDEELREIGNYSTSVYSKPRSCIKFLKFLKRKYISKYPSPMVEVGHMKHGLYQFTYERNIDGGDRTHIDWWIYNGCLKKVIGEFEEYEYGTEENIF